MGVFGKYQERRLAMDQTVKELGLFPTEHVLSHSVMSDSLGCHGLQPTGLLCP